jgi:hypothetical protein
MRRRKKGQYTSKWEYRLCEWPEGDEDDDDGGDDDDDPVRWVGGDPCTLYLISLPCSPESVCHSPCSFVP